MQVKTWIQEAEVSGTFDLTSFGTSSIFKNLLEAHDMEYVGQRSGTVSSYVWANEDRSLVMTTGNNPITGEYRSPEHRHDQKGYASFVLVAGEAKKAVPVWEQIEADATFIKGVNEPLSYPDGRKPVPESQTRQVDA